MNYVIPHSFHYRKKPTGWQVILSYKSGGKWRQKTKQGFSQKNLAKAAGDKLLQAVQDSYVPAPFDPGMENITFRQFWPIFHQDKQNVLSDNTVFVYQSAFRAFPDIYDTPMQQLTTAAIQQAINSSSYKPATIEGYIKCFKTIMSHAIKFYGILLRNPFIGVYMPARPISYTKSVVSPEDFKRLYAFLYKRHYIFSVIVAVGYYTGMRYGEIAGLTWQAIDLSKRELTVFQQFKRYDNNGKLAYKLGCLKTHGSRRTIPIPVSLQSILQEYKDVGIPASPDGRIFPLKTNATNYINLLIHKVLANVTMHTFRHTYATTLLSRGVDIKTVSALLGDRMETVIARYVHFSEEMRRKAAQSVENIFDS